MQMASPTKTGKMQPGFIKTIFLAGTKFRLVKNATMFLPTPMGN